MRRFGEEGHRVGALAAFVDGEAAAFGLLFLLETKENVVFCGGDGYFDFDRNRECLSSYA